MIAWRPSSGENVAPPAVAATLLQRAIAANPADGSLHYRLACLNIDRYDFAAAAAGFETARRLDPTFPDIPPRLARCYNILGRHQEALDVLSAGEAPQQERGIALAALGRGADAEREFRAILTRDPHHRLACRQLCKALRRAGRDAELLEMCEALNAQGVNHAQLLYDWGIALALNGKTEKASGLLLDPSHILALPLPVPAGFANIAAFNAALADEILTNPNRVSEFPLDEEANRGSSRVHSLLAGRNPDLVRTLLGALQELIGASVAPPSGPFDPWAEARPVAAHLNAWGLIQRDGDHETWHFHRGGWMSGVYYIRVPEAVSAAGDGPGCIEFGAPPSLARRMPDFVPAWRHLPREGTLLLSPSHYSHRTIPTGADEYRISFAFDVVPDDPGLA